MSSEGSGTGSDPVPEDIRTKISPSRRWAFRAIALIFILSGLGSIPLWRLQSPPTEEQNRALSHFSAQVQSRCEFVGANLWRSLVAGFPAAKTKILCGLSKVEYRDSAEREDPQGLTRAVIRLWGDYLRSAYDGMDLDIAIVPIGERTTSFACFRPAADPAWSQCDGNPEFGCSDQRACVPVHLQ
ncbi:MAG: hypothetical protein K2X47_07885 [Bdellovibrionales bacterium]|nr:hypothetical protein [Bdellovibrionales bacterium]